MHFGVIGIGPVGATFAAMLHGGGHRVSVLDNNPQLVELIKNKPLKIGGCYQAETVLNEVYTAFAEFADSAPEVVLISVKTYVLQDLLLQIKNSALATSTFVSCQNGIDTEKEIAQALGEKQALRMVLNFGVSYSACEGVTVNFLNEPHFLSCVCPSEASVAHKIIGELNAVGMKVEFVDDITKEVFKKAILNTCLSCVCTLTRTTMSEAMAEAELRSTVEAIIREGMLICKANGFALNDDFLDKAIAYLSKGGNHKPSMLIDVENGRRTEIRHLAGKLTEYAQRQGIQVPVTQTMSYLVKALEKSAMTKVLGQSEQSGNHGASVHDKQMSIA